MLKQLFNMERFIHSIKTVIACLLGIFIAHFIGFQSGQWIVITVIVVMCAQIYVGSVIQKSYFRFLGTLIGCLFAAFTIVTFGDSNANIAITIGLSSFIFSYLATSRENLAIAGTLGAVTTAIIMLGQKPTLSFALLRFLEISLGILIAGLVSQFVLPIHARTHLRRSQAHTLSQIRDYYIGTMMTPTTDMNILEYHELDEDIVKSLLKQRQLAKESAREPLGVTFDQEHFKQSLYSEREILRAITFMHNAQLHIHQYELYFQKSTIWQAFNKSFLQSVTTIEKVIESEDASQTPPLSLPSLNGFKEEIQALGTPSDKDIIFIDGFLFSADVLVHGLLKLAKLYQAPISPVDSY